MEAGRMTEVHWCSTCGRPLAEHDRDIRFRLPQPVLEALPNDQERTARTWGNDLLMQVQGIGAFVRILVPVRLTDGFRVTFGAWLSVHPNELRRAWEVWDRPEYMELQLHGVLANMLPPWEAKTYRKPLDGAVRVADNLPYATTSQDKELQEILTREWEHDPVLAALARYGA